MKSSSDKEKKYKRAPNEESRSMKCQLHALETGKRENGTEEANFYLTGAEQ